MFPIAILKCVKLNIKLKWKEFQIPFYDRPMATIDSINEENCFYHLSIVNEITTKMEVFNKLKPRFLILSISIGKLRIEWLRMAKYG